MSVDVLVKTQDEIDAELVRLRSLVGMIISKTFFDDSNDDALAIQIKMLEEKDIHPSVDMPLHTYDHAREAADWLTGNSAYESLAEGWEELRLLKRPIGRNVETPIDADDPSDSYDIPRPR